MSQTTATATDRFESKLKFFARCGNKCVSNSFVTYSTNSEFSQTSSNILNKRESNESYCVYGNETRKKWSE